MSFLDRIVACNHFDPAPYRPFRVAGVQVGFVKAPFIDFLAGFPDIFVIRESGVELDSRLNSFAARTEAVDAALRAIDREGGIVAPWREERLPVAESYGTKPLMLMERAAVPLFGVRGYGVHLNGVVRVGEETRMWIARRSADRGVEPGKLDQLVAGGQPAGLGLRENLIKECGEEAGMSAELAAKAVAVGAISYVTERPEGLRRDVEFIYDLALSADFVPVNTDGEVDSFELWPMERVIETARDTDDFKFNCSLVVIDYLIRTGRIEPDEPEYMAILNGLRTL